MKYTFKIITGEEEKITFVTENNDRLKTMINNCFYTESNDMSFLTRGDICLCMHSNTIAGIATINNTSVVKCNKNISTYDSLLYDCYESDDKYYATELKTNDSFAFKFVLLYPVLYSLCKDLLFKHVGRFLIKNIEDHYKKYKYLYLSPESGKYRNELNAAHKNNEHLEDINDKYKKSQKSLINYYESNGYVISDYLYEVDNFQNNCLFINIMKKRII